MIYKFNSGPGCDSMYHKLAINNMDGWIILPQGASSEYIETLKSTGKPVVLVSFDSDKYDCWVIQEDSFHGGEIITQHLLDHGRKRIAYVGCFELYDMLKRFEGYKEALNKNDIPFDPGLVIKTDDAIYESGRKAMQDVLKRGCSFSAVFAANDFLAFAVIDSLSEAGLRVPEDVAVMGYDDNLKAKDFSPSLSSMHQNVKEMGSAAAELIISIIKDKRTEKDTILFESDLILRDSCGCKTGKSKHAHESDENLELINYIIKSQEQTLNNNYSISSELLTAGAYDAKKLLSSIVDKYSWKCISFWENNMGCQNELIVQQVTDIKSKSVVFPNKHCTIEDYPLLEFIPDPKNMDSDHVIWILPISTIGRDWGILAYSSAINKANRFFAYDRSVVLLNLLGIFLDREMANSELKRALETIQQTQEQLIQSEKLVSLGGLVAGVAHEINTPLGVSVTAASYLRERSNNLNEMFQSGKLKRLDLEKYIEMSDETTNILLLNLNKASNLISSFKQIAVDQTVEEKRTINIREYVDEILLSLNPKLKKTRVNVQVFCPVDLEIYTFPGGLSQIITNLLVNSLVHAYNDEDQGYISINILKNENILELIYSDDGKGIEKEDLGKIFDPFFTTKRGSGGTGLGLNIVYNIVTQKYGGSIKCESELGKGTTFIFRIPL
jgi:signal transduction histidine kinase